MENNLIKKPLFVYKSYSKQELAQLYLPYNAEITAVRKFNIWLKQSPALWKQLQHTGMGARTRYFTSAQVQLIVDHLGEP